MTWETTPDGRSGWHEFFMRAGYDTYVSDAVERGRASWARYPEINKVEPEHRTPDQAWEIFRFGPAGGYSSDPAQQKVYPGQLFPTAHIDQFTKQFVARWTTSDAWIQRAYNELVQRVCPCIIIGHSQAGMFVFTAAQAAPDKVKAVIMIEPASARFTPSRQHHRCRAWHAVWLLVCVLLAQRAPAQTPAAWKPSRNVELVAGSAAGGGSDNLARLVQKILSEQKIVELPLTVINKPAAGGVVAWTGLNQNPMEGHHLAINTANLLTNYITGRSTLHYNDVTSVAQLFSEAVGIAVRADSPIKSARELAAQLKADAGSVSAAVGTSLGNSGHIALALVTQAAGGDAKKLKAVVFQSVSQGITALLGGHVDVVSTAASNLAPHHVAGRLRIVGLTAPQRYTGALAAVPTWREQGINVEVDNLRGVIGPKAMTHAQIAYWEAALARMAATAEWKSHLEKNQWAESFAGAQTSRKILAQQDEEMRAGLAALGMVK